MGVAGRADILSQVSCQRRYVIAAIPGLDRPVRFRSLTQAEHNDIEFSRLNPNGTINMAKAGDLVARSIAMTVCDDDGNLIFTTSDVPKIKEMDARITDAMMDVINANFVNRTSVDEMIKNCESDPTE
jgi:hypothetical protein